MTPGELIQLLGAKQFSHREELQQALADENCLLTWVDKTVPCKDLYNIYERRAQHLEQYHTAHATVLRDNCKALCAELRTVINENCRMWSVGLGDGEFVVFAEAKSNEILGCLRTVDRRKVSEAEWKELWGELKTS